MAPVVVPFFNANTNVTLSQQDNGRCHTACVSMRYLDEQHVRVLPWLAFSSDLSPIENLWDMLDCCMILKMLTSWRSFYIRSGRRSLHMKSRTLFSPSTDAALLSLMQMKGRRGCSELINYKVIFIFLVNLLFKIFWFPMTTYLPQFLV